MRARYLAAVAGLHLALATAGALAQDFASQATQTSALVVMLRGDSDEPLGAGIVVGRRDGRLLVATANHVLRRGGTELHAAVVLRSFPELRLAAKLLPEMDRELDLALLEVADARRQGVEPCALDFGRLGDSAHVERGQAVYPMGHPNGVAWALPVIADRVSETGDDTIRFQTQFLSQGHSGGALLNSGGLVLGLLRSDQPPFGVALRMDRLLQRVAAWGHPTALYRPLAHGRVPLHAAAAAGDVAAIGRLLGDCGQVDVRTPHDETPAHFAAGSGRLEAIELLHARGANLNIPDGDGDTPLHWAVEKGEALAAARLLQLGADPNHVNQRLETPLYRAVSKFFGEPENLKTQRAAMVRALLAAGARVDDGRHSKPKAESPLHIAVAQRSSEIAGLLLDAGAHASSADLSQAITNRDDVSVGLLLGKSPATAAPAAFPLQEADSESQDTPLNAAVESDRIDLVRQLLALGANPNLPGFLGRTALGAAMWLDRYAIEALLIERGASLGRMDRDEAETLLMDAVLESRPGAVRVLLKQGASPNSTGGLSTVDTLLVMAIKTGRAEIVGLLVQAGAEVNRWRAETPLAQAVKRGDAAMVSHLLRAHADPNLTGLGPRPLQIAVGARDPKLVKMLLEVGATLSDNEPRQALVRLADEVSDPEIAGLLRTAAAKLR